MRNKFFQYALLGVVLTLFISEVRSGNTYDYTWNGSVSSNWNTNGNWSGSGGWFSSPSYVYRVSASGNNPIISGNPNRTIRAIDISSNGRLTISAGNPTVNELFVVRGNGRVTVNGGNLTVTEDLFIYDRGSLFSVNGGTVNINQDIRLGERSENNDATNGLAELRVSGGVINADNIIFGNQTNDRGKVTVNGGTLNVNGDIFSNGEAVNLEISGSGVVNVLGDLRMDDGGDSLIMNGGTLNIRGDYINNGVSIVSGGTIVLNGTTQQSISSPSGANFYNLSLDNASGFSLSDSIIIRNQLNLTDGIIQSNGNTVTFLDNSTYSGGSVASFIDGPVNKVGNDPFVFPIGDNTTYKPLGISAPSNANDVFRAEYRFEDPAMISDPDSREFGVNNISKMEYWLLNQTMGLSSVNVSLSWDPNSIVQQPSNLLVVKWDNPLFQWVNLGNGGTTGNANNGSITSSSSVNDFTAFTLGSSNFSNPLPVELDKFTVEALNANAVLEWSTLSEVNNAYFEIQKSYDLEKIETVAKINSKAEGGNANRKLTYQFTDFDLTAGKTTYYRIKQVDHDGKFKLYDFKAVYLESNKPSESVEAKLTVYPNPSDGKSVFVEVENLPIGEYQLGIHNIQGKLLFSRGFVIEENTYYFEMEALKGRTLEPGIYIVRISSLEKRFAKKLIVE